LRLIKANGIDHVVMCVSHLGEQIQEYAGDGDRFGLRLDYSFDGPILLGTAGAIRQALPLLDESFFVLYGDSYLPCDFGKVGKAFADSGKQGLMTVFRNEGLWDTSNVEFVNGQILAYDKRTTTPQMRFIDYGLGLFEQSAFRQLSGEGPWDLAKLYQKLLETGGLAGCEVLERFYEIGSVSGLNELSRYLAS
jgi:NDP-sugar pyrophosphorylase family protein